MNENTRMYVELYGILNLLGENYINKLPKSLYNIIKRNVIGENIIQYKSLNELSEGKVLKSTISMLALLHLNYWCENQEEKDRLKLMLQENEEINEKKKREKYNPDNIFANNKKEIKVENNEDFENNNKAIIEITNKNIFEKIIDKIKKFFKKYIK